LAGASVKEDEDDRLGTRCPDWLKCLGSQDLRQAHPQHSCTAHLEHPATTDASGSLLAAAKESQHDGIPESSEPRNIPFDWVTILCLDYKPSSG
jgi:hypothetical protein